MTASSSACPAACDQSLIPLRATKKNSQPGTIKAVPIVAMPTHATSPGSKLARVKIRGPRRPGSVGCIMACIGFTPGAPVDGAGDVSWPRVVTLHIVSPRTVMAADALLKNHPLPGAFQYPAG